MQNLQTLVVEAAGTTRGLDILTEVGDKDNRTGAVRVYLNVSAVGGTDPKLDVTIVVKVNGEDHIIATFPQQVAVGKVNLVIQDAPEFIASESAVSGTTTPTISATVDFESV